MNLGVKKAILDTLIGLLSLGLLSTALLGSGCGAAPGPGGAENAGGDGVDPDPRGPDVPDGEEPVVPSTVTSEGPFPSYKAITLTDDVTALLDGDIATGDTTEIFEVGPLAIGDRLVVTAEAGDPLDPVVAIFDAAGDTLIVNDDRNYYGGDLNSAIDLPSYRDTPRCYVAVAASPGSGTTGRYTLSLRRMPDGAVAEAHPQWVYLNFDGAEAVVIGRREPVTIPVFEGSLIAEEFSSETDALIEQIAAQVRQDYIGLEVEFVSSREGAEPTQPHTTLHFGAYDPGLLGISDYVDEFNEALTQKGIIFVDTFSAFLPLNPSVEEMAIALANVASHEAGHLLGLNHTQDPQGIMDITANLRQMLASQVFRRAPLHPEVFPVGYQDDPKLLVEAVGGDLDRVKAAAAEQLSLRAAWYDGGDPIPARFDRPFSTCLCSSCVKHRHLPRAPAEKSKSQKVEKSKPGR